MPWSVTKDESSCSASKPWAVVNDDSGAVEGCHATKGAAEKQQSALYANTQEESKSMSAPRDDLVRMIPFDINPQWPNEMVLRMAEDGNTLVGYAAVFDRWTEINSWEGRFKERIKPGAFRKTLRENRKNIKVLFNHGMDPSIGDKPLGKPKVMKEDDRGLYVEVPLDDTSYNADLKASLRSGALDGMSFRMSVLRDEWDKLEDDLPERTIGEIRMFEFGPVTFPAYEATEAGVRAHAPQAFAAFRAAQQTANVVDAARERQDHAATSTSMTASSSATFDRIGSNVSYVYTPSSWPGWTLHSITTDGMPLYVRADGGVAPGDEGNPDPNVETPEAPADPPEPEETPVAAPAQADPANADEPVEGVEQAPDPAADAEEHESESDTLESAENSAEDAPVEDHPSEDAPITSDHPSENDAPVDSDHPSQTDQPERLQPWRMALALDRINEVVDQAERDANKRYSDLM